MADERLDALAQRLQSLDLEEREARVYAYLVARGPARAGEAAAATRLKRTETYRTLQSLMERGMVTAQLGRPAVYQAVPVDHLIAGALTRHEERRREIETSRDRIQEALAAARAGSGTNSRTGYKIIQGRRAIHSTLDEMLTRAMRSHLSATTYISPRVVTPSLRPFQTMVKRAQDGLPTRLLVRDAPGMDELLDQVTFPSVAMRYFDNGHPVRFTIIDAKEVLFWLVHDPDEATDARGDVAMWTNAPEFVRSQDTLFEALWEKAGPRKA